MALKITLITIPDVTSCQTVEPGDTICTPQGDVLASTLVAGDAICMVAPREHPATIDTIETV